MRNNCFLLCCVLFFAVQEMSAQQPIINSFSPTSGSIGTVFTIQGSSLKDSTSVKIGNTSALIISNTDTSIIAMVMPGSISGKAFITTQNGSDSSKFFTVVTSKPPTSQVQKLTGTGTVSDAQIGIATAVSADNKTILLSGAADNLGEGAVWVYTHNSNGGWAQYGQKLVPSDALNNAQFGQKLAISADGNTFLAGGMLDRSGKGSTWVFAKDTSGNWKEQAKLIGTNAVGAARQGCAVAISADGNTAVIGGYADKATSLTLGVGAVWVFERDSNNVWKQQGNKLVGKGAVGTAAQGYSVAISADGNTIMSGGITDSNSVGAVWVFIQKNDTVWQQQGARLTIRNEDHPLGFGFSVALSANGNTAIIGSSDDFNVYGGAWIFIRDSNNVWKQQGSKLVGADTAYTGGKMMQGRSVSISADGNTVISGGYGDNAGEGGAWIFVRDNNTWLQAGGKLLGSDTIGTRTQQGYAVSMSADGNIALLGGPSDNSGQGAGWVFTDSTFVLATAIADFRAYLSGKGVQTEWSAYNEINVGHFIVERSADGYNFKDIGAIAVKGNPVKNNYSWFDASPVNGNNYYRLKTIDKNGTAEYSAVILISKGVSTPGSINVLPNPVINKTFYLQLNDLPAGNYFFTMYDNAGKMVFMQKYFHEIGSETVRMNIHNISTGLYHIEVTGNDRRYQTRILIR